MDIHVNELIIEDGFREVPLKKISFRDIDQEFVLVKTDRSYGSIMKNDLYYCFIKPYDGIIFRLIGVTDEDENTIIVDEDISKPVDTEYYKFANAVISKIVEDGDLISNQLIVNLTYDYYHNNDDYVELMGTRDITWIDGCRVDGNPDWISIDIDGVRRDLRLRRCDGEDLIAEEDTGYLIRVKSDLSVCDV